MTIKLPSSYVESRIKRNGAKIPQPLKVEDETYHFDIKHIKTLYHEFSVKPYAAQIRPGTCFYRNLWFGFEHNSAEFTSDMKGVEIFLYDEREELVRFVIPVKRFMEMCQDLSYIESFELVDDYTLGTVTIEHPDPYASEGDADNVQSDMIVHDFVNESLRGFQFVSIAEYYFAESLVKNAEVKEALLQQRKKVG